MKAAAPLAAGFLAVGFGTVTYIAVIVEPQMGFATPADRFDPELIAGAYTSSALLLANLLYFTMPVAVWILARGSEDPFLRWSGVTAALLLFVISSIDRVAIQLPSFLPDAQSAQAALFTLIPVRFAVLKTMVVAWGVFAWRTTRVRWGSAAVGKAWGGLGYAVLALSVVFVFAPVPVPLALFIWAAALTVQQAAQARQVVPDN